MWMPLWDCLPKQNARAREMSKREEEENSELSASASKFLQMVWEYRLD